jgi:hypothetical protein
MTNKMLPKTAKFVSLIESTKFKPGWRGSGWNSSNTRELIGSLNISDFKEIFSDPYWNNYPCYYYRGPHNKKHGQTIHSIVRHIINANTELSNLLYKHSCGLFLKYTLQLCPPSKRVSLSKRGLTSKDTRVKKLSLKYSPIREVIKAASSQNGEIRRIAKERILRDGTKHIHLLDDERDLWYMMKAFPSFKLSEEEVKNRLERYIQLLTPRDRRWNSYQYSHIIANLLSRLKDDDLLFYFNLVQNNQFEIIRDQFTLRIGV